MIDWKTQVKKLEVYKYPVLLLLIGVLLMLLPTHAEEKTGTNTTESALEEVLFNSEGVGRVRVIVSDSGAVVVCEGAGNAAVRLDILRAIASYTGFGSDKITILKMSNQQRR